MVFFFRAEKDWSTIGKLDPFYGVISSPKFKSKNITNEDREEFFATGVDHANKVLTFLKDNFEMVPRGAALDFGCGVGRITNALAAHFEVVVGLDVSKGMLATAKSSSDVRNVRNVTYDSSLEQSRLRPETYDFVHTYIVLQHIPVAAGEEIIRKLLLSTKIGGVGAIHFTYFDKKRSLISKAKRVVKNIRILREIGNMMARRKWNYPAMQMNNYSIPRVLDIFHKCGIDKLNIVRVEDWENVGLFVFFQRSELDLALSPWSNPVQDELVLN